MDTLTYPSVETVVPVYNEELALPRSIDGLMAFRDSGFPFRWHVLIADEYLTDTLGRRSARVGQCKRALRTLSGFFPICAGWVLSRS